MPKVNLTNAFIAHELKCPPGAAHIEYTDGGAAGVAVPGLYVEVRANAPGQGIYRLRYKDAVGKTCHHKIGRTSDVSLSDARKAAAAFKASRMASRDDAATTVSARVAAPAPAVQTLRSFFHDSYLPHVKPRKRSWVRDESLYRIWVDSKFGERPIDTLTRHELQVFHAGLLEHGLSEASCDHVLALCRHVLNKAVEWSVLAVNPVARIKLFRPDNRLENYLSPEELQRLLQVLRTHPNRGVCDVALFLLSTGARLNEALSATWADIDRESRVWRIAAATSKSKRIRSVPLNDAAIEVLDQLASKGRSEVLFTSSLTGKKLNFIHKSWERIRTEAELPKLRLHDLRHQYASFLVNSGRTLYEVQHILGHSSAAVTERYAHLSSKSLMDAANSASAFIQLPKTVEVAAEVEPEDLVQVQVVTAEQYEQVSGRAEEVLGAGL